MSGNRWLRQAGIASLSAVLFAVAACSNLSPLAADPTATHPLGREDGYIESSLSPFDDAHPAIAKLDPQLRAAAQSAASDAAVEGVDMVVTSGWRSQRYQDSLLADAIVTYGSEEEALKWVSTAEESRHVSGDAVDFGPTDANSWLSQYGHRYGLCQTYANERWHYELAVEPGDMCPAPVSDAASR